MKIKFKKNAYLLIKFNFWIFVCILSSCDSTPELNDGWEQCEKMIEESYRCDVKVNEFHQLVGSLNNLDTAKGVHFVLLNPEFNDSIFTLKDFASKVCFNLYSTCFNDKNFKDSIEIISVDINTRKDSATAAGDFSSLLFLKKCYAECDSLEKKFNSGIYTQFYKNSDSILFSLGEDIIKKEYELILLNFGLISNKDFCGFDFSSAESNNTKKDVYIMKFRVLTSKKGFAVMKISFSSINSLPKLIGFNLIPLSHFERQL